MDETREGCLATILARGLIRVRQRAERAGDRKWQDDNEPQPSAADAPALDHKSADQQAATREQGEQQ
jgi:hypothetical protein